MARRWIINGRFLAQPVTGVQRVAREIVGALDRLVTERPASAAGLVDDLAIEIVAPRGAATLPGLESITTRIVGRSRGHVWEQAELPGHVGHGLLSLCNTGPLSVRNQIVCIHDANTRTFPASYSWQFRALYGTLLPLLGRRARLVSTVSRHAAGDLARFGICPRNKLVVIPNGHEHALAWRPQHSAATRSAAGLDTIVALGSPAPHKNIGLLLGLLPALKSAGLRLAIAGKLDRNVFQGGDGREPLEADNLIWLGAISDGELAALLGDCLCLAFPSLAEGFGLPPLEAMALGCPVVVSDRASLPEICADAALYASPQRGEDWITRFKALASDPRLRCRLRTAGQARAAAFTWAKAAHLYLEAMARVDGHTVPRSPALADA